MDEPHGHDTLLSSGEDADLIDYRPLCRTAVIALLLGVLSATVLVTLLMLPLAALACALAAMALWQIARSDAQLSGRWCAMLGLVLAIVFATAAVANSVTRTMTVRSTAYQLGDQWLTMVGDGELHRAHQLHLPPHRRQLPSTSLAEYYRRSEVAQDEFQGFFRSGPNAELATAGKHRQLQNLGLSRHIAEKSQDIVAYRYNLVADSDGTPRKVPFELVIVRSLSESGPRWHVAGAVVPKSSQ